jgi:integrase
MAKRYLMTWIPGGRRWRKVYKGKVYVVSCRQLGFPDTKEASWKAANEWWGQQEKLADIPPEDDRLQRAARISALVRDFGKLDEEARKEAVETLLGAGAYDGLKAQAGQIVTAISTPEPTRTVKAQVDGWCALLRGVCQSGQMSEGRFDAYCRNIRAFTGWIGEQTAIDAIDEAKLEGFFTHLTDKVGAGDYSPNYAHTLMMTAKQFISRLAELKLIPLPGNIRSHRFRFNHSAPTKIETFTVEELRAMLAACNGFSDKTQLYILLQLNCGFYQHDLAELQQDEVDWKHGTITRRRSKTRERGGPLVTYRLWPETFELLKKHRAGEGELALTTDEGNPLVRYWIEEGKMRRYDCIHSAWTRLAEKMKLPKMRLGMKHLRKTSATLLGQHPLYKFYALHFLADSPRHVADRHYVIPSDEEFFTALEWLRTRILPVDGEPAAEHLLDKQPEN